MSTTNGNGGPEEEYSHLSISQLQQIVFQHYAAVGHHITREILRDIVQTDNRAVLLRIIAGASSLRRIVKGDRRYAIVEPNPEDVCTVCLEVLGTEPSPYVLLLCCHSFHVNCILPWIRKVLYPRCPTCRWHVPVNILS